METRPEIKAARDMPEAFTDADSTEAPEAETCLEPVVGLRFVEQADAGRVARERLRGKCVDQMEWNHGVDSA